ncbi:translation elongation factor [Megasphaera cerevisiae DSM 20462]|jgi:selenocysteine-specific elongation factor|uniref:Selenocysteine-specific elongation factor n=1 Tax=Megasphaera cerevisiae DSM 20462 TaxID=1122219 RepID=A0A0J6X0E7_9FIRM|nr:selenocysteine-specific translation elongation factor [Megasphaera cerevisiae]KMO87622.1 translation elongation factor [Megasphaera cerevisiae DSM 20462]OKY54667.1 selenocysteine-specific translation elongation factor [Megasphaera cerevisiae]SJZ66820.1 selenocysteine-specific elongation factor [Megasphaera cerevisiae DSM 20462]
MSNIVIATAGHVDHGKTTLVKALTNIETDTTKEEKKRGLSINLGFAYLDLPNGQRVGIVDVPGHEKFIKNMVAGLPGINLVMLVIDAGEGVMPQTREHMDILTLLGIRNFLIVLTKVDMVDEEIKELAIEDIRDQLADTPLQDAEIIETDAISGRGMANLVKKLEEWTERIPDVPETGAARLNVDRVFSVRGFGTVVTGTLLDGSISIDDELTVYPGGKKVRVRNIQIHNQNVKTASARHRTALNLTNITKEEIQRGTVLSASAGLQPTWMIDVKAVCLKNAVKSIGLWDRVRLLVGTREIMARTVPLGIDRIVPGAEGFVQLRLEEQVVVKAGDHFILRTYSPIYTIAGGEVLEEAPKKHRRFKSSVLQSLKTKEEGNLDHILEDFLVNTDQSFVTLDDLAAYTRAAPDILQESMQILQKEKAVLQTPLGYMHAQTYKRLRGQAVQVLLAYHQKFPLRPGIAVEEFRSRLRKTLTEKECNTLLKQMLTDQYCKNTGGRIAAARFEITFTAHQKDVRKKIEDIVRQSGSTPVKKDELLQLDREAEEVLLAITGQSLAALTFEYVIAAEQYEQAVQQVRDFFRDHDTMTLADFRDMTVSSRKSSMLLLEYMDQQGITRRVENYRILNPL